MSKLGGRTLILDHIHHLVPSNVAPSGRESRVWLRHNREARSISNNQRAFLPSSALSYAIATLAPASLVRCTRWIFAVYR
jgi:hypothetical protein